MQDYASIEAKFAKARGNLLLVILFSTINIVLALLKTDLFFLFSATFPMILLEFGQIIATELGDNVYYLIGTVLAIISIAVYGFCYLMSRKRQAFILVALILFSFDTLFILWLLLAGLDFSIIINIAFHIWVLASLASGTKAWSNLKKLPPYEEPLPEYEAPLPNYEEQLPAYEESSPGYEAQLPEDEQEIATK